jgi:hypothetical protein
MVSLLTFDISRLDPIDTAGMPISVKMIPATISRSILDLAVKFLETGELDV